MGKRRPSGDGMVRKREDGRWEGRIVIGYDEKGLPKTKNVLAKTKTECVAKLKALRERLETPAPEVPKAGLSLGAWLDHWYQDYKKATLRPNTQMSYERRIYQHIIPALGHIQLDKLTTGDIQQFYTHLRQNGRLLRTELYGEGLSDQTVRGIHTTFHAALNQAVKENLIFHKAAFLELTVLLIGEDNDLFHPKPRLALWSSGSGMLPHDILHAAGPMMERSPFLVHLRIF